MSWFRAAGKVRLLPCGTFAESSSPARAALVARALAPQDEDGRCRRLRAPQNDEAVLRLGLILRCEALAEPRRIEAKPELIAQRSSSGGGRELKASGRRMGPISSLLFGTAMLASACGFQPLYGEHAVG